MSKAQRIRKLLIGPSEKITARNSVVGNMCIADYVSDNVRYLVFERAESIAERKRVKTAPKRDADPDTNTRSKPNAKPAKQDAQAAVV